MLARIYQPAKSAMQSGRGKTGQWVLEYIPTTRRTPDPLMGWTSSGDTLNQVRLKFDTIEEARQFAAREGLDYAIQPVHERKLRPRSYAYNFKTPPGGADDKYVYFPRVSFKKRP
jgi:hypothetical protein